MGKIGEIFRQLGVEIYQFDFVNINTPSNNTGAETVLLSDLMANIPHDQMIFMLTLVATLWQLKRT